MNLPAHIHYIPKWPTWAFIDALTLSERIISAGRAASNAGISGVEPAVYFVAFSDPASSLGATPISNSFRWYGSGEIAITDRVVQITTLKHRAYWWPKKVELTFDWNGVANVEVQPGKL